MGFFEVQKVEVKKQKKILNCQTCSLDKTTQITFSGLGSSRILILTDIPANHADVAWLEKRMPDTDCWWSSVVQCKCFSDKITNNIIGSCRKQWQEVVSLLKPDKIFLFGHVALSSFLGDRMSDIGVMDKWVGNAIPDQDYKCWVFPMYDVEFVRGHKNEAVEYLFSDHMNAALDHDIPFIEHKEDIRVITDVKEAIDYLQWQVLDSFPVWISFDYEGTGLKPYRKEQKLYSVSFSTDAFSATSFHLFDDDDFHDLLYLVLSGPSKKTCHNIQFEQKWTRHILGYEQANNAFDSMLAVHILDNARGKCGLKFQTYINYGVAGYDESMSQYLTTTKEGEDEKSGNRINNIHLAPLKDLLYYNALDSMFGLRLTMDQIKKLKDQNLEEQYQFYHDGVLALGNITENGMHIDEDYFHKINEQLEDKLKASADLIHSSKEVIEWRRTQNKELDILSPQQIKKLIIDVLKLKTSKKTKKGNYSVDEEVLNKLGEKNDFFKEILTYRKTHKVKGTYVEGFLRESNDGVIHPNQNLHTTVTYRPSTTDPNFSNIPNRDEKAKKTVRTGVIPSKGNKLLTVDYDGVEVCSGCFYHKDPVMISYVQNPENDMHRDQAIRLFKLEPEQITKKIRYEAKNGFIFPQFYGDWYKSNVKQLWPASKILDTADGILLNDHLFDQGIKTYKSFEEHVKEEERIFWKEKFKVFDAWKDQAWEDYLKKGYVEYLTGFRCGGILDKKNVVNYPFQGTAFQILLWSLIQLEKETRTQGWRSKVCLQVYDEMMFDVHPDEEEELSILIKDVMTVQVRRKFPFINVPMSVEIKTSKVNGNWFEMEELK